MSSEKAVLSPNYLSVWKRIVAGAPQRKTRFHDERGQAVPLARALRNGPRAMATGVARLLVGYRPERPWISYDAQALLAKTLRPDSRVLEFGSGMSTMWYARRAANVVSIENDRAWHMAIERRVHALGNIQYIFAAEPDAYVNSAPDEMFDLIMIDGSWRDSCARFAVKHLAPGGTIYLDNSDKGVDPDDTGDNPAARALLLNFARERRLAAREFTDFAPTQLFVQRGLMIGP